MESKTIDKERGCSPITKKRPVHTTPKSNGISLSSYGLHRANSPDAFKFAQDKMEIGWGDSPEPLKIESRFPLSSTPIRKKINESPRSSCARRRQSRPPVPPLEVSKQITELRLLTEKVMQSCERKSNETENKMSEEDVNTLLKDDDVEFTECLIACTQSAESEDSENIPQKQERSPLILLPDTTMMSVSKDSSFDRVLQGFINEDDDWMSQAFNGPESMKTPRKGSFVKSRSDDRLVPPTRNPSLVRKVESFRRTNSFGATRTKHAEPPPFKKQKSFSSDTKQSCQSTVPSSSNPSSGGGIYTAEEIQRKRLEATLKRKQRLREVLESKKKMLYAPHRLHLKFTTKMSQTNLDKH